jgi:hypothetical protein
VTDNTQCTCWEYIRTNFFDKKLSLVLQGIQPEFTRVRGVFYNFRTAFLQEHPELLELDTDSNNVYQQYQGSVTNRWCKLVAPKLGIDPELWWRVREKLNIWPQGRAICHTRFGRFLVDYETRHRIDNNCSFVIVTEKDTILKPFMEKLNKLGYKANIISTGGNSQADVQEGLLDIADQLNGDVENFYILLLHDYDLSGLGILHTVFKRYPNVIDLGINLRFLQWLENQVEDYEERLIVEQQIHKKEYKQILEFIQESKHYSIEDYKWLQGIPYEVVKRGKTKTYYKGKRVELDAVNAAYGTQVFIDYLLYRLEKDCKVWDLSRIGVEPFELQDPQNEFTAEIKNYSKKVCYTFYDKRREIEKPLDSVKSLIDEVVKDKLDKLKEIKKPVLGDYETTNWDYIEPHKLEEFNELKEFYKNQLEYDYTEDYQDDLDNVNEQITRFEGDVREGEKTLRLQVNEIQEQVEFDAENDEQLPEFKEKLENVDYGQEKLDKLEPLSEKETVRLAIDKLIEYLYDQFDEVY